MWRSGGGCRRSSALPAAEAVRCLRLAARRIGWGPRVGGATLPARVLRSQRRRPAHALVAPDVKCLVSLHAHDSSVLPMPWLHLT
jgi:hypothetical protein